MTPPPDPLPPESFTPPSHLDSLLIQHITQYVDSHSFVKLEAALAQMVYLQFKDKYEQADPEQRTDIESLMSRYSPNREQLKSYIQGESLGYRCVNTLANFFHVPYILANHSPAQDHALLS